MRHVGWAALSRRSPSAGGKSRRSWRCAHTPGLYRCRELRWKLEREKKSNVTKWYLVCVVAFSALLNPTKVNKRLTKTKTNLGVGSLLVTRFPVLPFYIRVHTRKDKLYVKLCWQCKRFKMQGSVCCLHFSPPATASTRLCDQDTGTWEWNNR